MRPAPRPPLFSPLNDCDYEQQAAPQPLSCSPALYLLFCSEEEENRLHVAFEEVRLLRQLLREFCGQGYEDAFRVAPEVKHETVLPQEGKKKYFREEGDPATPPTRGMQSQNSWQHPLQRAESTNVDSRRRLDLSTLPPDSSCILSTSSNYSAEGDSYFCIPLGCTIRRDLIVYPTANGTGDVIGSFLNRSLPSPSARIHSALVSPGSFVKGDVISLIDGFRVYNLADIVRWEEKSFDPTVATYFTVVRAGRKVHVRVGL